MRWPLRELLIAYAAQCREAALAAFRHEELLHAIIAPHVKKGSLKPPQVPAILKEDDYADA